MNRLGGHLARPVWELETARLKLRQWQTSDPEPFATMNADPHVIAFSPALLSRAESEAIAKHIRSLTIDHQKPVVSR